MDGRPAGGAAVTQHTFLESFDKATRQATTGKPVSANEVERRVTEAYEAGYKSGWEDAIASDKDSNQRISAEFERNIQNLNFTYNEALHRVRSELQGFLTSLLDQVLPELTPDLLRTHIQTELVKFGDAQNEQGLEIRAASNTLTALNDLIEKEAGTAVKIIEDPSLADWQVLMNFGGTENLLDVTSLIAELREQLAAICGEDNQEEWKHA